MPRPVVRQREGLPALVETPAPAGYTYCSICRGFQHPKWHQVEWRIQQINESNRDAIATFAQEPL